MTSLVPAGAGMKPYEAASNLGDWNGGMNRAERLAPGESVWMGFFLYHMRDLFLPLSQRRAELQRT